MPITIGSNIQSLAAQRKLADTTFALSKTFERLSSGQRINRASDDAAGLAVAMKLNADARIFTQGVRNANDVQSLLSIADQSVQQLSGIVTRINELTIQAMNGIYSNTQRKALDSEAQELRKEYNRIVEATKFNGLNLLDGTMRDLSAQVGNSRIDNLSIQLGGAVQTIGVGTFGGEILGDGERSVSDLAFADIDGDGDQDAMAAHFPLSQIISYTNDGSGVLSMDQIISGVSGVSDVDLADLDGDGEPDLVYTYNDGVGIRFNSGGTFGAATTFDFGAVTTGLILSDFNNDGHIDIAALASDNVQILTNNGSGAFSVTQTVAVTDGSSLTTSDFNNDGYEDLLSGGGGDDSVYLLLGQAGGTFAAATTISIGNPSYGFPGDHQRFISGDFNGDNKADVIFTREEGASAEDIFFMAGDGSGSFGSPMQISVFGGAGLSAGDLDGDGDLDFVSGQNEEYFINDGSGSFTVHDASTSFAASIEASGMADLNGDGVLDLVIGNGSGGVPEGIAVFIQDSITQGRDLSVFPTLTLLTPEGRTQALADIEDVRTAISLTLANIGAYQSRMDTAIANLQVKSENVRAAASRIQDVDVAEESAKLVQSRILQQVGATILAQANLNPEIALSLLR